MIKLTNPLPIIMIIAGGTTNVVAQFGPIGYDFKDPYVELYLNFMKIISPNRYPSQRSIR